MFFHKSSMFLGSYFLTREVFANKNKNTLLPITMVKVKESELIESSSVDQILLD